MGKPPRYQSGKKSGKLEHGKSFPVVPIHQGAKHTLYSFSEKASELWKYVSINRREENKDDGYQRVLANSRVRAVADYIKDDNIIPRSIIISVDKGKYDPKKGRLAIGAGNAVKSTYSEEWKKTDSIFFKTVGFGALMNVFEDIFKECTMQGEGFRVSDIVDVLRPLQNFDFAQWSTKGSGNKAEMEAAKDFQVDFARSVEKRRSGGVPARQLKLR
ncbi:MAG: hypothetical protein P4M05_21450 [Bradyrhizobium sp.]|nr:hypothetical protein [Bradyrhizobium sp.]